MLTWNPWHGCHKISAGCRHCYVFREDAAFGVATPTSEIHRTASFSLPLKTDRRRAWKYPAGTEFSLCFTSDFLIEEADGWRPEIWDIIRRRNDCRYMFFTKRIERLEQALPSFWEEIADIVSVGCTVENQDRADYRMPIFLSLPLKHRIVVVAPMIEPIALSRWLDPEKIEMVTVGGESGKYARPLEYEWVVDMHGQCVRSRVPFVFHQTGSYVIKDGRRYTIPRNLQHSQAKKAGLNIVSYC